MPTGMYLVGGSKGRPTGLELRGCQINPITGQQFFSPCAPVIAPKVNKQWQMIKSNDWYYKKGSGSSTTGGASTGGNAGAKARRT
jgi:hypothetical protein